MISNDDTPLIVTDIIEHGYKYVRISHISPTFGDSRLSIGDVVEVVAAKNDPVLRVYYPTTIIFQGVAMLAYAYRYERLVAESDDVAAMYDMLYPGWRGNDGKH